MAILAHQDDEVAIAPLLKFEVNRGHVVRVFYATDGATKSASTVRRCSESIAALQSIGVAPEQVVFLGADLGVGDGTLMTNLPRVYAALQQSLIGTPVRRIYTLAWEGGHADHDAAHLLALAFGKQHGIADIAQFPIYNGFRAGRFFRVMQSLPGWTVANEIRFRFSDGLKFAQLPLYYPSQRRTWLGLISGVVREYLVKRRNITFTVSFLNIQAKPHRGALLYERLFHVPYETFRKNTASFIDEYLLDAGRRD